MSDHAKTPLDWLVRKWPRLFHDQCPARSSIPAGWTCLVDELCELIDALLSEAPRFSEARSTTAN